MQKYYFITVFQSYDEHGPHGMRTWGFYNNFQAAEDTLVNNVTDLWETCYDYGVIEEYEEGISNYQFERWFYKYDQETDKYLPIDDINELRHYAGFAVG